MFADYRHKRILILGAGEMQLPIIFSAKELGCYIIVADHNPLALGLKHADKKLLISTNNIHGLIQAAVENKIDGVLTTSDSPVKSVASICEKLKLSGPTINSASICTNKYLMRKHLAENQFLIPKFEIIYAKESLKKIGFYPCVIKPVDSSGSRGVQKVNDYNELVNAYNLASQYSSTNSVIVEEFIDGNEYSIETLTQNNQTTVVAITEKTVIGDNGIFFVENRHIIPAELSSTISSAIKETVINLITTLNLVNSPSHTELKITPKGIYIIEVGARLGGDFITSSLVPLATGVNMLQNAINIALNIKINVDNTMNKYSGIQFITSENYFKVVNYLQNENKSIVEKYIKPFKDLKMTSSFDRLGYFIVQANSKKELLQTLNCN